MQATERSAVVAAKVPHSFSCRELSFRSSVSAVAAVSLALNRFRLAITSYCAKAASCRGGRSIGGIVVRGIAAAPTIGATAPYATARQAIASAIWRARMP
jgi:hypothetical protein